VKESSLFLSKNKKEHMKQRLLILLITICVVFQLARLESYMGYGSEASTEQLEQEERVYDGYGHDADITARGETHERKGVLDNARKTKYNETEERRFVLDNPAATKVREKAERSANLNDPYLTNRAQNLENKDLIMNNQSTAQEERKERVFIKNNASLTERMEKEARQPSH
jgi:ABC-type uncharacterized transport system involved in gliding motility auxiliary subunit